MPSIFPIGTHRVSDLLLQKRLLAQFQYDRNDLIALQDQLSTGYRITTPSQDPPAAMRAITLQRMLEQKSQAKTNLENSQSFLTAAEDALGGVGELVGSLQARALTAINVSTTDREREMLRNDVERAIEQLTHVGNRTFRGRHLFSGSAAEIAPFAADGPYVAYSGNEGHLSSYVDVALPLETNISGQEVFGAISPEVRGTVDLRPVLTPETRLADLRGGAGIASGSVRVSDGTSYKIVDLTGAQTVGDVMRTLHDNPPEGRELTVRLTAYGLSLQLDAAGGGSLMVRDLPGGSTAADLGILDEQGSGVQPLVGEDLSPRLVATTRLQDCFGVRARAVVALPGAHNDLIVTAAQNGASWNGVQVRFVSNVAAGDQALATYNAATATLEIDVNPLATTADTVVDAINASGLFTAELDDQLDEGNDGSGPIDLTASAVLSGGAGTQLDQQSGIQIVNRGETYTLTFDDAITVEDLLNQLNFSPAGVLATINSEGTGIDVRSRISGADFAIGENGGTTAADLGIRTFGPETQLSQLNYAEGVHDVEGTDFVIQRKDGTSLAIDIASATDVTDVLNLINQHAQNADQALQARIAEYGNGIEILDFSTGAQPLTITRTAGSAVWELGLIKQGENQVSGTSVVTATGNAELVRGDDVARVETKGVFNSLVRLRDALSDFDVHQIERAVGLLEEDFDRLTSARAELGARGQVFDILSERLDSEDLELQKALSSEIDADMVEIISDLAKRQASMQASLQLIGRTVQLTLLNYL